MRVLVVQQDAFALSSIANALEYRRFEIVGRATTAVEALELQRDSAPDVALLDLDLGAGPTGIDLAQALRIRQPELGIVMLSGFRDPRVLSPGKAALPLGTAYLCKADVADFGTVADCLVDATRSPLKRRTGSATQFPVLTDRQLDVLRLVADGLSTQAIADELDIRPKGVEQAISRLNDVLSIPRDNSSNSRVRLARAYLALAGRIDDPQAYGLPDAESPAAHSTARTTRSTTFKVLAGAAGSVLVLGLVGLAAASWPRTDDPSRLAGPATEAPLAAGTPCTPVLMVVRHGEDQANPNGGADILSSAGERHAALYPMLFADYVSDTHGVGPGGADVPVCPIGRIIAINPEANPQNTSPGTNPYETIRPLADALGLSIEKKDASGVSYSTTYDWTADRRKSLLSEGQSTVIAWDKQGLNPSADDLSGKSINGRTLGDYDYVPLLKAMPTNADAIVGSGGYFTPNRTDLYVFSLQDPATGQFGYAKRYVQSFSDDGGATWYTPAGSLAEGSNPNAARV